MNENHEQMTAVEHGLVITPTYRLDQPKPTATLAARMAHYQVPGISVAVIDQQHIAWTKGYGLAQADHDTPVTPATRFYAASLSKPITAMAVLALVDKNEFRYYPQAPDTFFAIESDGDLQFISDAQGQITHLALRFSHANFQAKRWNT